MARSNDCLEEKSASGQLSPAFLRLPLAIRSKIYGLIRSCPISIDDEQTRWASLCLAYIDDETSRYGERTRMVTKKNIKPWQNRMCAYERKNIDEGLRLSAGAGCVHPNHPIYLLRVSKQIKIEVTHILYSKNSIKMGPKLPYLPLEALVIK